MILDEILKILKEESDYKAYTVNNESYTYKELYKYVCNIYRFLLSNNKEKTPVVVYGEKEIYMKASFIACSMAGMTYVPINESMPHERVKQIIKQVNPSISIGINISKEDILAIMEQDNQEDIKCIYMNPTDVYYIIFTSGSTGVPKGVEVTYENLDSCINWLKSIVSINKGVIINQANFSFDLSVADLYLSLVSQSEHYIINSDEVMNFGKVFQNLSESNANLMIVTPSFVDLLLLDKSFNSALMPNLETIMFCGEKLLKSTVDKLYSRFENIQLINCYGPTECTFAVTSFEVLRNIDEDEIPIGAPKKDVDIYLVDENGNEVKDGEEGEIVIIGESVAKRIFR